MINAMFLDRDGTLIPSHEDRPISDVKDFRLLEGVVEGLRWIHQEGYKLYIVSNQSGIADGKWSEENYLEINNKLQNELDLYGLHIEDFFMCPHSKTADCNCRKPKPGMIFQARDKYKIDLKRSYMLGNELKDIKAGKEAGCTTILVGDSYKNRRQFDVKPDFQAENIEDAVRNGYIRRLWRPYEKVKTC